MRSALLWDITELIVVLPYCHVETVSSIFSIQAIQDKKALVLEFSTLYHYMVCNIAEERRSQP